MTGLTKSGQFYDGLDEPLHAYISGPTVEEVQNAVKKIKDLIDINIYDPENEKVKTQLTKLWGCHSLLITTRLCTVCG